MTPDENAFLTALQQTFGSGEFTAHAVVNALPATSLPLHLRRELSHPSDPPRNPARLLGRWLAYRGNVAWGGRLLVKTRKVSNVQHWKVETPGSPDQQPGTVTFFQ